MLDKKAVLTKDKIKTICLTKKLFLVVKITVFLIVIKIIAFLIVIKITVFHN